MIQDQEEKVIIVVPTGHDDLNDFVVHLPGQVLFIDAMVEQIQDIYEVLL